MYKFPRNIFDTLFEAICFSGRNHDQIRKFWENISQIYVGEFLRYLIPSDYESYPVNSQKGELFGANEGLQEIPEPSDFPAWNYLIIPIGNSWSN